MSWALAALTAATLAQATELPRVRTEGPTERTLTIYRDDLAFVTETHVADLPAGRSEVVFTGVNDRMVPQTAVLAAFEGLSLERNFDQGLLTKASLFASLVGEQAVLVRTDAATGEAAAVPVRVLAADRGVVLRTPEGVEALDCAGLPQRLAARERPAELVSRPELSVVVEAEAAGPRALRLAYLAEGIGWSADYVLTVGEEGTPAALRGWLTFTNGTADGFEDVPAAIVAGTLQRAADTQAPDVQAEGYFAACWPQGTTTDVPLRRAENPYLLGFPGPFGPQGGQALLRSAPVAEAALADAPVDQIVVTGSRVATEERFGDYRLYRPPGAVTLTPYRTKQVRFLDEAGIEAARRYEVAVTPSDLRDRDEAFSRPADVLYVVDNEADGALARALPAGTVRVMTERGGEAFFLGQDELRDLAVGLPVEVGFGRTNAVSAEVQWRLKGPRGVRDGAERAWQLDAVLRNALGEAALVRLTLPGWVEQEPGFRATGERARRLEGRPSPAWQVEVPPGGQRRLSLTLRWDG